MSKKIEHELVPKHEKLSQKDKEKVLEKYNINLKHLPSILKGDPAIGHLKVKSGDIIKITRESHTNKKAVYYRVVING